MPFNPEPFELLEALKIFSYVFLGTTALVFITMSLIALGARGKSGPGMVLRQVWSGIRELTEISLRRVAAIATLTYRESVRRKVLLVFVLFAVLFMFAGWFMGDSGAERPDLEVQFHVSFVLRTISWLMLPVVLLLSCWGLPEDIKARSLHTVVTKPVRRSEVVLGRMLGFASIGTLVLMVMGVVGYIWIQRQVPDGAREMLVCRVPVYGEIAFTDRDGDISSGTNVGFEWEFRKFIEGGTKARAIWKFDGITADAADEEGFLLFESRFEAFRLHKGDMSQTLLCVFNLYNEDETLRASTPAFPLDEFGHNLTRIDRRLVAYDTKTNESVTVDLFDDLAENGTLIVKAQCVDAGQFLGMAQSDLFVRLKNRSFLSGFVKSISGTWLMMVLVVIISVMASCFLKGPIAAMLTFTFIIIGEGFREFMETLVSFQFTGGGPVESIYRMVTHMNIQTKMDESIGAYAMKGIDSVLIGGLWLVQHIIPKFDHFSRLSQYLPNGFDVSWSAALLPCLATTLAFIFPCVLVGCYSLKLRELESK